MSVGRAVGRGFSITHRGWPVIAIIFVFYAVLRFFSVPNDNIPPYLKNLGDWEAALLIFAVMVLGVNYLLAGTQAFAKNAVINGRSVFKGFFGNCNRYFLGQLGVSLVLWLPSWIIAFLAVALWSGTIIEARRYPLIALVLTAFSTVLTVFLIVFVILISFSWAITAADGTGVFKSIWKSVLFCGRRFFGVSALLLLIFALILGISLIAWISYAFVVQGLRRLSLDGQIVILREVVGCALYAYFFVFSTSSLMSYYLNNRKEDERYN